MSSDLDKWSFFWGGATIALIVALLFILLMAQSSILDVAYSMLSGVIVGFVTATISIFRGIRSGRAAFLIFAGLAGAVVGWFFALLLLKITTLTLMSDLAVIFELMVGTVGASSLCFFILSQHLLIREEE